MCAGNEPAAEGPSGELTAPWPPPTRLWAASPPAPHPAPHPHLALVLQIQRLHGLALLLPEDLQQVVVVGGQDQGALLHQAEDGLQHQRVLDVLLQAVEHLHQAVLEEAGLGVPRALRKGGARYKNIAQQLCEQVTFWLPETKGGRQALGAEE